MKNELTARDALELLADELVGHIYSHEIFTKRCLSKGELAAAYEEDIRRDELVAVVDLIQAQLDEMEQEAE